MAPQVRQTPRSPAHTDLEVTVDTRDSSAPAHPSTERDPDETPHACYDGWVFIGHVVESEHDLDGEIVVYDRVPCRRCSHDS